MRPRPIAAALGATALLAAHLIAPPAALAIAPPVIDPGALPPNDTPGPTEEMKQNKACVTPVVATGAWLLLTDAEMAADVARSGDLMPLALAIAETLGLALRDLLAYL